MIVSGHLSQCKVYDVAVGELDFQSAAMCTDRSLLLTCMEAALGTPHHVLSIDQCQSWQALFERSDKTKMTVVQAAAIVAMAKCARIDQ